VTWHSFQFYAGGGVHFLILGWWWSPFPTDIYKNRICNASIKVVWQQRKGQKRPDKISNAFLGL